MLTAIALTVLTALGLPPGEIAFLGAQSGAAARIHVVACSTMTARAIGPEHAVGAPAWSPDGARIAFAAQDGDATRIYVANADGSEGRFLAQASTHNADPVWSPDGTRIAYTAGTGLDTQIVVTTLETGEERTWGGGRTSLMGAVWTTHAVLDRLFERIGQDARPAFLPDLAPGDYSPPVLLAIGYVGGADTRTTDLFALSESEAAPIDAELLPSPGTYEESSISVSPEGITFDSNDGGDREIFVIGRRRTWDASNHAAADWRPVWSPNARWIAFESFRGGTRGIYRCQRQSSRVSRVIAGPSADCWDAAWSPDSLWIAYTTDGDGSPSVWAIRADGEERIRISPANMSAGYAAWRPAR